VYDFHGVIDEVVILNVALTSDDIKKLMENGIKRALPVSPKGRLAGVWGELKAK
jgi:hypothetical protein